MKSSVLLISMEQTHDDVFVRFQKIGPTHWWDKSK